MPNVIRHLCFDSALRATLSTNGLTFVLGVVERIRRAGPRFHRSDVLSRE